MNQNQRSSLSLPPALVSNIPVEAFGVIQNLIKTFQVTQSVFPCPVCKVFVLLKLGKDIRFFFIELGA